MSYLIDYSAISSQKTAFDNYYNANISNTDQAQVAQTVLVMTDLAEAITTTVNKAPPYVGGFFSRWITQPRTENNQEILKDVRQKLDAMIYRSQLIGLSTRTVVPIIPQRSPSPPRDPAPASVFVPQNPKINAEDYAVGFGNMSNNCWANSLLSMIVCVPSLKEIYSAVAKHYAEEGGDKKLCGEFMLNALQAYETALSQKKPVDSQVSQNVRMAFHELFGQIANTGREIFSDSCHAQEDAYEALQLLMSTYQKDVTQTPSCSLYCPLETTRRYAPNGEQRDADPKRCGLSPDPYSQLASDNATHHCCLDYQIFLDMQSMGPLSFSEMFKRFFTNVDVSGSDDAEYLLPNMKVQKFKLTAEERKFLEVPNELTLTLKRFGSDMYGNAFKIKTPVAVERMLWLPAGATPENKPIPYELISFIVHSGEAGGGHYLCYKKMEGRWIEANDSRVRFVAEHEIDAILQGRIDPLFTSYMHHYSRANPAQQLKITTASEQVAESAVQHCIAEEAAIAASIKALEALPALIPSGSTCLDAVPDNVLGTLRHAIWLHDKTPDGAEYGTIELKKNPKKVLEIKLPWLIEGKEITLLDQLVTIQKNKLAIASHKLNEARLNAFLAKLDNPTVSNDDLIKAFQALPEDIRRSSWGLQGLIYEIHKKRFGEAYVHDVKFNCDYGKYALENGDLRKTLSEALNENQKNIVQQLALAFNLKAKLLEIDYEKQQLEGFLSLLDPAKGLTEKQLEKAFERLEIRPKTRQDVYKAIWLGRDKPPGDRNYGGNTLAREPRCLIEITKSLIESPETPLAPAGSNILQQVIALLDEELNHFRNPVNNRMRSL